MQQWKTASGLLPLPEDRPLVMGIVNVTPDSFSDGGQYADAAAAAERVAALCAQGADIIDLGGQSTRPGHTAISAQAEWARLEPVLRAVRERGSRAVLSVDTYHPEVARSALEYGAAIINDVTGLDDPAMRALIAESGCGCVVMHHDDITGCADPVAAVRGFFARRVEECIAAGIAPGQIMLDIGIGFGKRREQELRLTEHCGECAVLGLPVLVGASRKRLTVWMLEREGAADAALLPMAARDGMTHRLHRIAAKNGARVVRVHDVAGAVGE